jgi:F-type H+-transporting ATPase subunit b
MDIQITQIIFQIINFSVVVGALTFLLYKPVLKIFDERARRIEEGQKAAEKAIETQEKIEEMKDKAQKDIQKQRAKVLEEAQAEAKKSRSVLISQAKVEAQAEVDKLKAQWQEEKEQIVKNTKTEMTEAVIKATKVIIGTTLDTKAQKQLIETEINTLLKQI